MIDHVSVAVSDLERAGRFYETVLATLGLTKLVTRERTIGFGKAYPEFWINLRDLESSGALTDGAHVALRARSAEIVQAFHAAALEAGGVSDGAPGPRDATNPGYYAAFIRDADGNRIEAVTFLEADGGQA